MPDIIEIDAASNRGIEEIRQVRESVKYRPIMGKYKVYIIDEAHMLTTEAFNALLKTLEEPAEYVVFILATTEPHKLPQTIISRTQRYDFKDEH
jgi:DNA polymerase-3 subunit gamma/tau